MAGRRQLLRWTGWFAAVNAVLFGLVGLRYLVAYPWDTDALGVVYAALTFIAHFALLAALPALLVVAPVALLTGRRAWVSVLAVLLMSAGLTLLVVDANVFTEQRYHLTLLTAMLFEARTWIFVGIIGVVALAFEALLAGYVWRWVDGRPVRGGRLLAATLVLCWLASQGIHIWADAIGYTPVTQFTRYLPAYFPIHAKRTLVRLGLLDAQLVERARLLRRTGAEGTGQLGYPLQPLQCEPVAEPANILVVLIDGLRPDAIHPGLTPNVLELSSEGIRFSNHWSGGNSSKAGLFSMFYGLPSTYMRTFYGVQQPPLLIAELRRRGYQLGLFAAPGFGSPADIGRTVFAGIAGLPGERHDLDAVARNQTVTEDWLAWLAQRPQGQPFFGFLYYDPPMGEMAAMPGAALPLDERFSGNERAREAWRRYRLAARLIDGELGRVLASLRSEGVSDETIVVVLSDHGYEFDDNGLGYIGHASNYSAAQLRTPLVIRWPGRAPAEYHHRSSHHDLPVTLLQDALGCRNDPADYAVGRNLFAGADWEWIIAGSYNSHAIVEPQRVVVTHPGGFVEILGADYRPLRGAAVEPRIIEAALRDMRRFYR